MDRRTVLKRIEMIACHFMRQCEQAGVEAIFILGHCTEGKVRPTEIATLAFAYATPMTERAKDFCTVKMLRHLLYNLPEGLVRHAIDEWHEAVTEDKVTRERELLAKGQVEVKMAVAPAGMFVIIPPDEKDN